ncbi:hypothetical protein SCMC78_70910 [Streptomyces sp. CMC78]|uniref:Uncharacterized protein n=1 Tax=Streptomyces sp. CMC78 TaxID=3231512 RepID=A0AB33KTV7_9ACTN
MAHPWWLDGSAVVRRPAAAVRRSYAGPAASLVWPNRFWSGPAPPHGAKAPHRAFGDLDPGKRAVATCMRVRRDGIRTRHLRWSQPQGVPKRRNRLWEPLTVSRIPENSTV